MSNLTKPVFVDPTGRRRLIFRIVAIVLAIMLIGLLVITLFAVHNDSHGEPVWKAPSSASTIALITTIGGGIHA